jgi:anti-sigma regulatory factor (Ser/Thr protein kinase)
MAVDADGFTIETVDHGRAWAEGPPAEAPDAAVGALREGGLGLAIIRNLATSVEHHPVEGGGTRWRVFRARAASQPTGEGDVHGT